MLAFYTLLLHLHYPLVLMIRSFLLFGRRLLSSTNWLAQIVPFIFWSMPKSSGQTMQHVFDEPDSWTESRSRPGDLVESGKKASVSLLGRNSTFC